MLRINDTYRTCLSVFYTFHCLAMKRDVLILLDETSGKSAIIKLILKQYSSFSAKFIFSTR